MRPIERDLRGFQARRGKQPDWQQALCILPWRLGFKVVEAGFPKRGPYRLVRVDHALTELRFGDFVETGSGTR